jgi:hypothetical protein
MEIINYEKYKNHKEYYYVCTIEDYETEIAKLQSYDSELALDAETYTLREWQGRGGTAFCPHTGRMSLLILKARQSLKPIIFDLIILERLGYDRRLMYNLLNTKIILAFRAQFDLKFIKRHYGFIPPNVICVNYLVKLIGNASGSKFAKVTGRSLKDVIRELFGITLSGKGAEQVTDWYPRPPLNNEASLNYWFEDKLVYGAGDVKYLHLIVDRLVPVVCNPLYKTGLIEEGTTDEYESGYGMQATFDLDMQAVRVAAELEYNGIPASKKILEQLATAIYDKNSQEGLLVDVGFRLCKIFKLQTVPCLWTEGEVPTEEAWKELNNPIKMKTHINKLAGSNLDSAQSSSLQRIVLLLEQLDKEGSIELVSDAEETAYRELELMETSEIIQTSKIIQDILLYKKLSKFLQINLSKKINPLTGHIHSGTDMLGTSTGRSSCIAKGQKVLTVGGHKPIEEIKVGDLVYCYDPGGKVRIRKVLNWWYKGIKDTVKVKWQSSGKHDHVGSLVTTPDHFFMTKYEGWQKAEDLCRYQKIYHLCNEVDVPITNHFVTSVIKNGLQPVYDIEVEEFNNFIAEELCVHNSSNPNNQNISARTHVIIVRPFDNLFPSSSNYEALTPDWTPY